ncbi:uncharacterized protein LOC129756587 [Uranotaenia lowii]|uniref:uncharacterized protein LOC129756587 n=1 Tax=Uranotaenia lowii TaxID=190385 RepID=UPI002479ED1B|nr:uncharacterized protein LOC129756587 [Uranotaenia lowii]
MNEFERFRKIGYIFASVCSGLSILELVKGLSALGGDSDFMPFLELLVAALCLFFCTVLVIGIRFLLVRCVNVCRIFFIVLNILMILYTVIDHLAMLMFQRRREKGMVALFVATLLLIVVFIVQLWILRGVHKYVSSEIKLKLDQKKEKVVESNSDSAEVQTENKISPDEV